MSPMKETVGSGFGKENSEVFVAGGVIIGKIKRIFHYLSFVKNVYFCQKSYWNMIFCAIRYNKGFRHVSGYT